MTKHNYQITRRLNFQAENTPLFHKVQIEVGVILSKIVAIARGTLNITGGTASGTVISSENPFALFAQKFEVFATAKAQGYPGGTLKSLLPVGIGRRRIVEKGFYQPDLFLGSGGLTGAAVTGQNINSPFQIRFAWPQLIKPVETGLRLDNYRQLTLKVTNGGKANLFSGNDRTFDYSGIVWDFIEYREFVGDYQPPVVGYEEDQVIPITQANRKFTLDSYLSPSEAFVDILWIATTTNNALADTIVNEVFLKQGSEQFYDQLADHIKAEQVEYIVDASQSMTGLYYTPVSKDMGQDRALLEGAVPDLGAMLDVSHPGTDNIILSARRCAPVPK